MTTRTTTSTRVPRSMELYEKAKRLVPGATQLISRRSWQFAEGVSPLYASKAKGSRFWDVDGHEYVDWVSSIRAIILGYCDPVVDEAVKSQIDSGTMYTVNHEVELELADELVNSVPCAEMVRYAKGGGEACTVAVRIARGATGRDLVLFCGYHGWHDWYLSANHCASEALDQHLFSGIEPIGVPKCLAGTALPFAYGELDSLSSLLEQHKGEVAAIIMEPYRSEMPPEGYLEGVRKLADEHDTILIFDEVSTGLRLSPGGVQPALNVIPDLAVFAKCLSNGYSMGAVVGRRAVMEPVSQMFVSSTYWSDTVGIQAALTTMQEVRRRDTPGHLETIGSDLQRKINAVAKEVGAPVHSGGLSVTPTLVFDVDDADLKAKVHTLYIQEMAKRGIHTLVGFCPNGSHGPAEVEQTVDAARDAFTLIAEALDENRVDELLECEPKRETFRRLVR